MNLIKPDKIRTGIRHGSAGKTLGRITPTLILLFLTGCRGAPSINLLGSFFPGWMLCVALGVAGTLVAHQVFIKVNIEPYLRPRVLVYFCLWGLVTLLTWLLFFRS